jgi:general secretion pathway protein D
MDIIQKIETVNGFQTIDGNEIPIVAKRQASSVVSVLNGQMVVLGGLTDNNRTFNKRGIPILRDIPILGYLFSGTRLDKRKTELMVLLQPTVLRTPEDAAKEAIERRNDSKKLIKMKEQVDKENEKEYREPDRIPF